MILIEVRINKEVRDYQESVFFGLSLRQLIFALLAVLAAVGVCFGLRNIVGSGEVGWVCILAAFPFALGGFFIYNGILTSQQLVEIFFLEAAITTGCKLGADQPDSVRQVLHQLSVPGTQRNFKQDVMNGVRCYLDGYRQHIEQKEPIEAI